MAIDGESLSLPSWYTPPVIPPSRARTDPISPLALMASSSIIADRVGAISGRRAPRAQRKRVNRAVYDLIGASQQTSQTVGYGRRMA
jgi:hypothetical protein